MHRVSTPVRNVALWLLALFSGALALLGAWVILDRLPGMEAVLDDGTATPTQVYGGQSWVVVGAAVLAAGLIGLTLTLAVAARAARPSLVVAEATSDAVPTAIEVDAKGTAGASDTLPAPETDPTPSPVRTGDGSPADAEVLTSDDETVPASR